MKDQIPASIAGGTQTPVNLSNLLAGGIKLHVRLANLLDRGTIYHVNLSAPMILSGISDIEDSTMIVGKKIAFEYNILASFDQLIVNCN